MITKLIEVGRKFSKANETKLRKALESISELLAQLDVTEAERSHSDRRMALQRALTAAMPDTYCWICDVFDETLVYSMGGKYLQCSYSLDDAGNATFSDATEVLPQTIYNPIADSGDMQESAIEGDCVPLVACDLTEAATASLKLISPGWGSSGYYSPSVLRSAASVFPKGLKMYWNHQTAAEEAARPEGDLDKLAAELVEDAQWQDQGASGPGLYAKAKVFERYAGDVKDLAQHIGVSIRAAGMARPGEAEGRKGTVIEKITTAKSVDFVTVPGAGGQVLSLFESAGRRSPAAIIPIEENGMNEEQIKALIAADVKPIREALTAAQAELAETKTENARLREAQALSGARQFIERRLATITMPAMTRQRLAESLVLQATVKDGKLDEPALTTAIDEAAKAELSYLAAATGGFRVTGMGAAPAGDVKVTEAELAADFKDLFGLSEAGAQVAVAGRQ